MKLFSYIIDHKIVFLVCFVQHCKAYNVERYFENKGLESDTLDMVYSQNNDTWLNAPFVDLKFNVSSSPLASRIFQRWKLGRISRKQYEIMNFNRRKKSLFGDKDNPFDPLNKSSAVAMKDPFMVLTTVPQKHLVNLAASKEPSPTSTISYIEFYYSDENVEPVPKQKRVISDNSNHDNISPRLPQFTLNMKNYISNKKGALQVFGHLFDTLHPKSHASNDPLILSTSMTNSKEIESLTSNAELPTENKFNFEQENDNSINHVNKQFYQRKGSLQVFGQLFKTLNPQVQTLNKYMTISTSTKSQTKLSASDESQQLTESNVLTTMQINSEKYESIPNDRIRFFEIYDANTRQPREVNDNFTTVDTIKNLGDANEQMLLENMDMALQGDSKGGRHVRKMSETDFDAEVTNENKFHEFKHSAPVTSSVKSAITTTAPKIYTYHKEHIIDKRKNLVLDDYNDFSSAHIVASESNSTVWNKYPFVAAYIYDSFQVHCDAAAINPYWLIASASCLSRHRVDPRGEDRSAFVSYCGDNWWNPKRILYVKSAVVHPRYNPQDNARRIQYNIGVIQVESSMASACSNWAPVTIMSYQFMADSIGSLGTAIGWGLDRYDTSYTIADLPKRRLSLYNNVIYSDNCPGTTVFRLPKQETSEASVNIYCLTLPPYNGEENDPVHGSLLMVGGKLIGLFLQEERRRTGMQVAQYTGVWKLFRWVQEVAHEPDGIDLFA